MFNGVEFWAQSCGNTDLAANYIKTVGNIDLLESFTTTRDFLNYNLDVQDYSNMTHNIEICYNGNRYERAYPIFLDDSDPGNYIRLAKKDPREECSVVLENTLFVDYSFDGFSIQYERCTGFPARHI